MFNDTELLERALTHSSCDIKHDDVVYDNERLEFLGDRILGLAIADKLFIEYQNEREGMLAKRHTSLVRKETLAEIALKWHLSEYIRMSDGEAQSGGREKPSILSDTVEAILAAIYLDSDFNHVKDIILKHWQGLESTLPLKDAKSSLQEWLQKRKEPLPIYELKHTLGDAHDATFIIEVAANGYGTALGQGTSKQQAEQNAATNLLEKIEK
ncbi:MAG: ribonuclease-3 [Alphaproteobacteria bacterium]|jgi:ribonuclease-3